VLQRQSLVQGMCLAQASLCVSTVDTVHVLGELCPVRQLLQRASIGSCSYCLVTLHVSALLAAFHPHLQQSESVVQEACAEFEVACSEVNLQQQLEELEALVLQRGLLGDANRSVLSGLTMQIDGHIRA
jgi:hypothetical protein